jgi:hypothetical protein
VIAANEQHGDRKLLHPLVENVKFPQFQILLRTVHIGKVALIAEWLRIAALEDKIQMTVLVQGEDGSLEVAPVPMNISVDCNPH